MLFCLKDKVKDIRLKTFEEGIVIDFRHFKKAENVLIDIIYVDEGPDKGHGLFRMAKVVSYDDVPLADSNVVVKIV